VALAAPLFWWATGLALWPGIVFRVGFAGAMFLLLAALFALRALGGGDVKLLTALALWIEPTWFLRLLVIMSLIGGILTLVFAAWHVSRRRKDRIAIPYGLAIASAGLWVLSAHYWPVTAAAGALR